MQMDLIDSGVDTAAHNMAKDDELLRSLQHNSKPILHFYDWQAPCATCGYFTLPEMHLNVRGVEKYQLELARRPTGGGIIFHQFDFAFSFLLPSTNPNFSLNTLDNYSYVNQIIAKGIQHFLAENENLEMLACPPRCPDLQEKLLGHFCMAKPTVYDIMCGERKVAGGAQRRTKNGYLHQASIALMLPPDEFLAEVIDSPIISSAIKKSTFPLVNTLNDSEHEKLKIALKARLIKEFSCKLIKS